MFDELRFAYRSLKHSPGFVAISLTLLTVGIALNTAAFSTIATLVRQPVSFERCDRIALLWQVETRTGAVRGVSLPNYVDWRRQAASFESIGALQQHEFQLDLGSGAETITGARVTPSALAALRWKPVLGRPLDDSDADTRNGRGVLVAERFWRERLGAAPDVIGRTLQVDGEAVRVVGILPRISRSFYASYSLWVPVAESAAADRNARDFQVIARLRDGATFGQAQAEMRTIAARLASAYPQADVGETALVEPITAPMAHVLPLYFMLLSVVGMVLLLVCANMANLQLARAAARQKETAVRAALGAGRWRIVREMSWETVLLAVVSGSLALLLTTWVRNMVMASVPEIAELRIDMPVFAFTLLLSLGTGLVFGLAPALACSRIDLNGVLKGAGVQALGSRLGHGLRRCLVGGELAVAMILLVGAGLLLKSSLSVRDADPGFRTRNMLTARISLPAAGYGQPAQRVEFAERIRQRAASLAGVEAAEVLSDLPLFAGAAGFRIEVEGSESASAGEIGLSYRTAGPGYLRQFGIPLVAGREFSDADQASTVPVAILNQNLAGRLFPNRDAVGKRLRLAQGPWLTVIGVSRDVRSFDFNRQAAPEILVPYAQNPVPAFVLALRTAVPAQTLAAALRSEIRHTGRDAAIGRIQTLEDTVADAFGSLPLIAGGMGAFAGAALFLATVGLYGLVSQLVMQRTREIGIRVALGAAPGQIVRLFVGQGFRVAGLGVLAGIAGAFALTRLLAGFLFGVSPLDVPVFLSVAALLAAIEIAATWLPARRLAHTEPATALRHD